MAEQYKGYEIFAHWDLPGLGYKFSIKDSNDRKIHESAPYFEEENAIAGAKEAIDKMEKETEATKKNS